MPSIRSRVERQVSSHSRTVGAALARWGNVAILHASRDTVVAQVKKDIVEIRVRGHDVRVACSCPLQQLGLVGCRHVYATLVAIERTGALGVGRGDEPVALRATMMPPTWPSRARAPHSASTSSRPPRRGSKGGSG